MYSYCIPHDKISYRYMKWEADIDDFIMIILATHKILNAVHTYFILSWEMLFAAAFSAFT
jgi:hypothetical protein